MDALCLNNVKNVGSFSPNMLEKRKIELCLVWLLTRFLLDVIYEFVTSYCGLYSVKAYGNNASALEVTKRKCGPE